MPRSRRDKRVDLTRVGKKATKKKEHVEKVRKYFESYSRAFVVTFFNPRNQKIAEMKKILPDAQLVFGKNRVTMLALGRTPKKEYRPQLQKLSQYLKGQCALLLTNLSREELRQQFDSCRSAEFARAGSTAIQTVVLAAGAFPKFSHTMEPYLRQLGLPVKLVRGVVNLEKEFTVCKKQDVLTPEQCRILKLFDLQLSEFRVGIIASWDEENGVQDVQETDSELAVTSLPPAVRVTCQRLDDGQYYFVPEPIDASESNPSPPETMEE
ncbi:unnamed protein product [Calicophoron daubneyi]|uniref:Ribosome assembly factor mrt4 n=1 Tax=Calicophoron daubneyi TaxID=300641 RepID=A0AAV2TUS2_CALDB